MRYTCTYIFSVKIITQILANYNKPTKNILNIIKQVIQETNGRIVQVVHF
jgi:hypothetical protein